MTGYSITTSYLNPYQVQDVVASLEQVEEIYSWAIKWNAKAPLFNAHIIILVKIRNHTILYECIICNNSYTMYVYHRLVDFATWSKL